ncbi:hypothetical protein MTR67_001182 [Solanum verrucosum]|uniref:Integrase catalytic domain-containing protein n=1 Tax=Solanum verrucosum TaxID=315347 RepID=A0AAF0PN57_SOLVR|nr:hypothetical protein MTR67_001182 [Solanum verrucosum]
MPWTTSRVVLSLVGARQRSLGPDVRLRDPLSVMVLTMDRGGARGSPLQKQSRNFSKGRPTAGPMDAEVKEKQDSDPALLQLKGAVHQHKVEKDGQAKRTIQTLEDMLRACMIDFKGSLDDKLPLIEFAYNNRYHSSIQMAPYEALYGRRCRSPVGWFEVGEAALIWIDSVHDAM